MLFFFWCRPVVGDGMPRLAGGGNSFLCAQPGGLEIIFFLFSWGSEILFFLFSWGVGCCGRGLGSLFVLPSHGAGNHIFSVQLGVGNSIFLVQLGARVLFFFWCRPVVGDGMPRLAGGGKSVLFAQPGGLEILFFLFS